MAGGLPRGLPCPSPPVGASATTPAGPASAACTMLDEHGPQPPFAHKKFRSGCRIEAGHPTHRPAFSAAVRPVACLYAGRPAGRPPLLVSAVLTAQMERSLPMPIPPRVSVVALRTADLTRSTAFYTALGWELSPASTPAMSMFKTAGSLLLVCDDALLAELGGEEVAAALASRARARPSSPSMWPPMARSTPRSRRRPAPAAWSSSRRRPPRLVGPMRSSPTLTGTFGKSSTTRCTGSGPTGDLRSPRLDVPLPPPPSAPHS